MFSERSPRQNRILGSLSETVYARIAGHFEPVDLVHGSIIGHPDDRIDHVHFVGKGMISVVAVTEEGQTVETGVIGREGLSGGWTLSGDDRHTNQLLIQLPGYGWKLSASKARAEFEKNGEFGALVLKFMRAKMIQVSQTAACNRIHIAERRLAKWLSTCRDRWDHDEMPITQEFAATMLGSNRVSVTQAAIHLQQEGLIDYKRGRITVIDRSGLAEAACECYGKIKREYDRLDV
jgi:CRP-like cAMP-binding protein